MLFRSAMYVPAGTSGYLQIAFLPWVYPRICDNQQFNINKEEVLLYQEVSEKMNEYYWESLEHYLAAKRENVEELEEVDEDVLEEIMKDIKAGKLFH